MNPTLETFKWIVSQDDICDDLKIWGRNYLREEGYTLRERDWDELLDQTQYFIEKFSSLGRELINTIDYTDLVEAIIQLAGGTSPHIIIKAFEEISIKKGTDMKDMNMDEIKLRAFELVKNYDPSQGKVSITELSDYTIVSVTVEVPKSKRVVEVEFPMAVGA